MKKIFMIALVAIFTMGMSINAQQRQGQGRPAMTPADRVERLAQQITLSADEKAKVLELFEKQQKRNQEAFAASGNNQNTDREAMRTRMQELQKTDDADLEAIIGKEKMAQYQKIREEQRASRGQGRQRN
jgi:hypothetical protein